MKDKKRLSGLAIAIVLLIAITSLLASQTVFAREEKWFKFFGPNPSSAVTDTITPSTNTPTPNILETGAVVETPLPTPSPVIVTRTIDLSPNIPAEDKFDIYVLHPDRSVTLFLAGPLPPNNDLSDNELPPEIRAMLNLSEGDSIIFWRPPSPFRRIEAPDEDDPSSSDYVGNWTHSSGIWPRSYGNTVSWSNTEGDLYSFSFHGY